MKHGRVYGAPDERGALLQVTAQAIAPDLGIYILNSVNTNEFYSLPRVFGAELRAEF